MLVPIGGGGGALAAASQLGIHWHVASKVEYIASDPDRQNITWVRSVDPETGAAKVYTSPAQARARRLPVRSERWIAWIVTTVQPTSSARRTGA